MTVLALFKSFTTIQLPNLPFVIFSSSTKDEVFPQTIIILPGNQSSFVALHELLLAVEIIISLPKTWSFLLILSLLGVFHFVLVSFNTRISISYFLHPFMSIYIFVSSLGLQPLGFSTNILILHCTLVILIYSLC